MYDFINLLNRFLESGEDLNTKAHDYYSSIILKMRKYIKEKGLGPDEFTEDAKSK